MDRMSSGASRGRVAPAAVLGVAGLAVALAAAGVAAVLLPGAAVAMAPAGVALATAVACRGMALHYPHARAGACNVLTLARAAMPALLAATVVGPGPPGAAVMWALAALAALALAADGVDGWLARRSGLDSGFGARFDMEVDAALAAMLCLVAIGAGKAGPWLLPLGFMRYAFVAVMPLCPWLGAPLPPRAGRKTACVIQIAVLALLLAPPVAGAPAAAMAASATLLLTLSFAADIRWLWRHR
jgi:phosphatidylglycerophosphate synthase